MTELGRRRATRRPVSIPGLRTELGTEYSYYWGIADFITLVNLLPFICRLKKIYRKKSIVKILKQLFYRCTANTLLERLFLHDKYIYAK